MNEFLGILAAPPFAGFWGSKLPQKGPNIKKSPLWTRGDAAKPQKHGAGLNPAKRAAGLSLPPALPVVDFYLFWKQAHLLDQERQKLNQVLKIFRRLCWQSHAPRLFPFQLIEPLAKPG